MTARLWHFTSWVPRHGREGAPFKTVVAQRNRLAVRSASSWVGASQRMQNTRSLIVFDRRGTGLSDPLPPDPLPPWESYAEDLAAVLDEVGAERPGLLAEIDAGPTAILFAATKPERVSALILSHTTAKFVATDDYPIGLPAPVAEDLVAQIDQRWGSEALGQ